ncbi:MAG: hypothetical protein QOH04_2035 [Sphingomonadales bacterium]|jgi:hypothetical protein|nr:hypothetical protein [Sphingomonadales bacterium]
MRRICLPILALLAAAAPPPPGDSRGASPALTYADAADLALAAPVAAQVRIAGAAALKDEQAAGFPAGLARFYVEADLVSLIRAPQPLPARVAYLVDLPRDARGKAPKLRKGADFLILAAPVPGRPGELRLVAPDAQIPFTPAEAERLRGIVREAAAPAAPPRITGIGKAFHVPGAIPGESETQIFLQTAGGRPVSLSILRRPGQTPQWAVALSEIVDEAAAPPAPGTLLWYRLACTLPPRLPAQSLGEADADGAAAIEADYRLVLDRLEPCVRSRRAR